MAIFIMKNKLTVFAEKDLIVAIEAIYGMIKECGQKMIDLIEEFNKTVRGTIIPPKVGAIFLYMYYRKNALNEDEKIPSEVCWFKVTYYNQISTDNVVIRSKRMPGRIKWAMMRNVSVIRNKDIIKDFDVRVAKINGVMKKLTASLATIRKALQIYERNDLWTIDKLLNYTQDPPRLTRNRKTQKEIEAEEEEKKESAMMEQLMERERLERQKKKDEEKELEDFDKKITLQTRR